MTQSTKLPKDVLSAAWAIALGAIAPMLDSTMVNIAIDQLTKNFSYHVGNHSMGDHGLCSRTGHRCSHRRLVDEPF